MTAVSGSSPYNQRSTLHSANIPGRGGDVSHDLPAELLDIPHNCDVDLNETATRPTRQRLIGLDAARGIALIGMMATHIISPVTDDGDMSFAWMLASGKSAALFAVVAGLGLALMTGGHRPHRGRRQAGDAVMLVVRAVLIAAIGLLLGYAVPADDAGVILPYYGALFLLSIPLMRLGSRALFALGITLAIGMPVVSHFLRLGIDQPAPHNLTFTDFLTDPSTSGVYLLLTGLYPALTWMAYMCIGLGIGRLNLRRRKVMAILAVTGAATAIVSSVVSLFLLGPLGGRNALASSVMGEMSLGEYTDMLTWGGDGATPTSSAWWLAVNAPHLGSSIDMVFTTGVAVCVLAVALMVGFVSGGLLKPLAGCGSMTLTLYSAHLLMLQSPLGDLPETADFVIQVILVVAFGLVWHAKFKRGPLEGLVHRIATGISAPVTGPQPRRAIEDGR